MYISTVDIFIVTNLVLEPIFSVKLEIEIIVKL